VELVECGTAIITDANEQNIIDAYKTLTSKSDIQFPKLYGDGKAAEFICGEMKENLA
jgi:UDP-GlcNAc3NAcA epimerase